MPVRLDDGELHAREPITGTQVTVQVVPRLVQPPAPAPVYNGPGRIDRATERADVVGRTGPVTPRKLGHCVIGTTDPEAVRRFFVEGIGFKVSDEVKDTAVFLRCSIDHHNLLIQNLAELMTGAHGSA